MHAKLGAQNCDESAAVPNITETGRNYRHFVATPRNFSQGSDKRGSDTELRSVCCCFQNYRTPTAKQNWYTSFTKLLLLEAHTRTIASLELENKIFMRAVYGRLRRI